LVKFQSQKVASNKLEKGPIIDFKTVFLCLSLALVLLEKIFKDLAFYIVLHLLFRKYSEFLNHVNKPRYIPAKTINPLGVIFSDKKMLCIPPPREGPQFTGLGSAIYRSIWNRFY
jgi:hypothetical protein